MEFKYNEISNKFKLAWILFLISFQKNKIFKKRTFGKKNIFNTFSGIIYVILISIVYLILFKTWDFLFTFAITLIVLYIYLFMLCIFTAFKVHNDGVKLTVDDKGITDYTKTGITAYYWNNIKMIIVKDNMVFIFSYTSPVFLVTEFNKTNIRKFIDEVSKFNNNLIIKYK